MPNDDLSIVIRFNLHSLFRQSQHGCLDRQHIVTPCHPFPPRDLVPWLEGCTPISALYRVRWQIEIAIKRWKSVLDVGKLRAKEGSPLAAVWLLGKLLYAVVVERRARRHLGADWSRLDGERRGTFWRVWKLIQDEVRVHILGVAAWREEGWEACVKVIMERPRRRKLQRLPDAVIDMYHGLPTSDQEELREAA
jgi:hypothetical protein